jgi:hypothetical protein
MASERFHQVQAWNMRLTCERAIQKHTAEIKLAPGVIQGNVWDFNSTVRRRTSVNWGSNSAINPFTDRSNRSIWDCMVVRIRFQISMKPTQLPRRGSGKGDLVIRLSQTVKIQARPGKEGKVSRASSTLPATTAASAMVWSFSCVDYLAADLFGPSASGVGQDREIVRGLAWLGGRGRMILGHGDVLQT